MTWFIYRDTDVMPYQTLSERMREIHRSRSHPAAKNISNLIKFYFLLEDYNKFIRLLNLFLGILLASSFKCSYTIGLFLFVLFLSRNKGLKLPKIIRQKNKTSKNL